MVTAREAYEIMDKYISNNPKDGIMNFSETSDAFVFGTKCNPSFGYMAVRKSDGEVYIMHIVDYAEHVENNDNFEIDMRTFKRMQIAS
nr:MAG TPA: hypothetical protein [Caudoviricetes sp.]